MRPVAVTATIRVNPSIEPNVYVGPEGLTLVTIHTADGDGTATIIADSLDELHGWLLSVASAVEERQAPKLPLEDVLSTHPEAMAG